MKERNENRPGYKKTKVGWIPKEWGCSKLGDIATRLKAGVSVNSLDMPALRNEPRILKTSCVSNGTFRPTENKRVRDDEITRLATPIKANTVIISRMNTQMLVGANAFVEKNYPNLFLPDRLWQTTISDTNRDNPRWFGFIMGSTRIRYEISARATGTSGSMKNVAQADIRSLNIPHPPLPEQKKIAEILSFWDTAIEQTRRLIEAKKRRQKGLMQQLLCGKKRLPGYKKAWKEYLLGDLFEERKETNGANLPLLAITGGRGVILSSEIDRKDSSSKDKSRYKKILPGDIGYNTMRMWQGVSAVSSLEGIVSPAYTICIPKQTVDVQFMGYFFKFPSVINLFWRYSQGLVADTLNLKFRNFALIKVTIPDIDE